MLSPAGFFKLEKGDGTAAYANHAKPEWRKIAAAIGAAHTVALQQFRSAYKLLLRFLNRIVFCFFAEDTGLLPKKLFSAISAE